MDWSQTTGIHFSPPKYSFLHFQTPRQKLFADLPDIPEMTANRRKILVTRAQPLRILGIRVDPHLSWHGHVEHIVECVKRRMHSLQSIFGSTWGLSLYQLRRLYFQCILPRITYACGAWYL